MRGDSLQDFYAKALALLGLGVLAGAGALVDYWPTSQRLPDVTRALAMPDTIRAVAANAFVKRLPAATLVSTTARRSIRPADESSRIDTRAAVLSSSSSSAPASPLSANVGGAEPHATPPIVTPVTAPDIASALAPGASDAPAAATSVASIDPADRTAAERAADLMSLVNRDDAVASSVGPSTPAATSGAVDDGSFLTGAVKKTGSSIMRGGTKTGTSIVGAFRALGGAVRRAFPG